jgi:hypothetical protein
MSFVVYDPIGLARGASVGVFLGLVAALLAKHSAFAVSLAVVPIVFA